MRMRRQRRRDFKVTSRGARGADNRCRFCRENIKAVDYKDVDRLGKLMTSESRMFGRKRSGNCARHQRMFKTAVKRARFMALLSYC